MEYYKSFVFISLLFNSMLTHGVIPDEMLLGTITPIVKNRRKSVSESSNYRAITLSSILGKLFNIIILIKIDIYLSHWISSLVLNPNIQPLRVLLF